jgi:hypothetical protein
MHYPNLDSWEWGQDDINNAKKLWSIKWYIQMLKVMPS